MHPTTPSKPLRAYGDRDGDGMVQISFSLQLPPGARAREAAKRFAEMHGLADPIVATMESLRRGLLVLRRLRALGAHVDVRPASTCPRCAPPRSAARRLSTSSRCASAARSSSWGRCTGSDAHTVGIDAILNYKGYAGDKGLESYKGFEVHNLGAQVENDQLAAQARALRADAILVSQVITQRNCHKENGRALVELLEREGWRRQVILLFGGPRVDHQLALELGFDAGFGPGTKPSDVASFLVERMCGPATVPAPT